MEKNSFGAALIYFTGSAAFNVKLRHIAARLGYKVNEYGIFSLEDEKKYVHKTEKEMFDFLSMAYIVPQLREDRGEIEASMAAIRTYENDLCRRLIAGLEQIPGLRIYGIRRPERFDQRVPTVSFTMAGLSPREIAQRLAEANVFCWSGNYYALAIMECLGLEESGGMLRVGLAHYNTAQEVNTLLGVLDDMPCGL